MRTARVNGFTLIELLVVIAIIALLIGILLPALSEARKSGRLTVCQSNMRSMATAMNSYATEYQDKIPSFTITNRTANLLSFPDLRAQAAGDDLQAASAQAVDILRRRADREDIAPIDGWIPHVLYNHLVLQDYLASRLPERSVVCPEDANRLRWQSQPLLFGTAAVSALAPVPSNAGDAATGKRWPYSSSYEFVPAAYSPDRGDGARSTITQAGSHRFYRFSNAGLTQNILGRRKLSEVQFPAQKVFIYDSAARHFSKRPFFYAVAQARAPVAAFDASVVTRTTGVPAWNDNADMNPGADPANPVSSAGPPASPGFPLQYSYEPETWEPAKLNGGFGTPGDNVVGFHRWTRGGLSGIDFGGNEVRLRN
jgi:prepilin-type N-terminal cleavage/methylation domain-containing protein